MVTHGIGRARAKAIEILRSAGLAPLRQVLSPSRFQQAYPVAVSPQTILVPEVVFWLMATAALVDGSMAGAAISFWSSVRAAVSWLPAAAVTEEAFCMARGLLPLRFFLRLFAEVVRHASQQVDDRYRWKGHRLRGLDGMDANVPRHPHLRRILPPPTNQHGARGYPQGRLVGLVGLRDGVCYAFRWTSLLVSEQASARRLLRELRPLDLLLADRNFPDKVTFAGVRAQGADFLFHLPSNRFLKLARTPTPSRRTDEWYVQIALPADLRRQFPSLGPHLTIRVLQYQRPGYRVSWLATSLLDSEQFGYDDVVNLYHERWRQETFHREWKHTLELSNLRSHSATGLLKEVLVQLTLNNAIRCIMAEAAPPPLAPVNLKFLEAKRLILAALPVMATASLCQLPGLYQDLLEGIARGRILVRPGRSYPRQWDARGRPKGHGKIVPPARLTAEQEKQRVPV